jgi:hypothetical protein
VHSYEYLPLFVKLEVLPVLIHRACLVQLEDAADSKSVNNKCFSDDGAITTTIYNYVSVLMASSVILC